jgi:hypothetical protein
MDGTVQTHFHPIAVPVDSLPTGKPQQEHIITFMISQIVGA